MIINVLGKTYNSITKEIIGKTFNQLTIEDVVPKPDTEKYSSWNTSLWVRCKCTCGNIIEVPFYGINNELIKSCGCLKAKLDKEKLKNQNKIGILLTYNGETKNLLQWSKDLGIKYSTIKYRYAHGMPPNKILEKKDNE